MSKMMYKMDGSRYEIKNVEDIYEKSGRKYIDLLIKCDRCSGSGFYGWGAVINGNIQHGGVCYKCGGAGKLHKTVRAYTEEQIQKENEANARKVERQFNEEITSSDKNLAIWCEKNGFNPETKTTICILGNTFPIKDSLKEAKAKFNQTLKWHLPEVTEDLAIPADCYTLEVSFDQIYTWDCHTKMATITAEGQNFIANYELSLRPESTSEYVGTIKERLRNLAATYEGGHSFYGPYGQSFVHTFKVEGNIFVWFTTKDLDVENGSVIDLTGTVKDHKENKFGEKTTILTRCIIK